MCSCFWQFHLEQTPSDGMLGQRTGVYINVIGKQYQFTFHKDCTILHSHYNEWKKNLFPFNRTNRIHCPCLIFVSLINDEQSSQYLLNGHFPCSSNHFVYSLFFCKLLVHLSCERQLLIGRLDKQVSKILQVRALQYESRGIKNMDNMQDPWSRVDDSSRKHHQVLEAIFLS